MKNKKVYIETYGCQMNVADSEVIIGLLQEDGHEFTENIQDADVILVNTCSVRENAEGRVYGRLGEFKRHKSNRPEVVVGVLGCMAERFRDKIFDKRNNVNFKNGIVDIVVGPDEYRKLPELVSKAWHGEKGIAVQFSRLENYEDITPIRKNGFSAWIPVMRGCNNFCSFCVVPHTRGRERSRSAKSILQEIRELSEKGLKEITLLGQNVNSYYNEDTDFAELLRKASRVNRNMRFLFTTSHPKDLSDRLIEVIAEEPNIAKYIHLPVQSGSDRILDLMNRNYNSDHYCKQVDKIKNLIPGISLTTDIISGFPTETIDDHQMTLDLIEEIKFDGAFMFAYSPRENTKSYEMNDDVLYEEKISRLNEIIKLQNKISLQNNKALIGKSVQVLAEEKSKKSDIELKGRTNTNKKVIFPASTTTIGEYVTVKISHVNSATLFGCVSEN